ncbi:MAG: MFS transporter [Thermomicrobiales bacterium]
MLDRLHLPRPGEQSPAIRRYTAMIFILLTAFGASDLLFNLYLTRLGYREDFIGLVNAVTQLVWAVSAATAGALAHRWTSRRVLIAGALVLGAGYAARGAVTAPWLIIVTFSVGCIGGGWVFAIGMNFIADYTTPARRLGAIALYTMASSLSTTLGSIGGGWLPSVIGHFGGARGGATPIRLTLLLSAGIIFLSVLPLLGVGPPSVELGASLPPPDRASSTPRRRTPAQQTRRDMAFYFVFAFVLAGGVAMVIPFYNVYLSRHGFSTGAIGVVYGCGGICGALFGLAVPVFGARVGIARGAGILRAFPGLFFFALIFVSPAWLAAAAHIGRRGCFDASYALESNFASRLFPARVRAHVFAWREATLSLGIALLSPIGGLLIVHFGYRAAFAVFAVATAIILAIFLGYFVPRERQLAAESAPLHEAAATLVEAT